MKSFYTLLIAAVIASLSVSPSEAHHGKGSHPVIEPPPSCGIDNPTALDALICRL